MSLPERFLHKKTDEIRVSVKTHVIGLLIGLGVAVCFYAWMYMMREALRLQSINEYREIIILSSREVNFYNLFTAFLATLTGQSVYFTYLASLARIRRVISSRWATSIFNDASNLLSVFLLWLIGMVLSYSVCFVVMFKGEYAVGLFAGYKIYFILFIVVIFLNQWLSLRRIFRNRSLKWMLVAAIVISGLSFGLSRINFIDYKSVNKSISGHGIYSYADIELPCINDYDLLENGYVRQYIFSKAR